VPLLEQEEQVVERAAVPVAGCLAAGQASDIILTSAEQGECPLSLKPRISGDGQLPKKKLYRVGWLAKICLSL
jgi:hypothetical protein